VGTIVSEGCDSMLAKTLALLPDWFLGWKFNNYDSVKSDTYPDYMLITVSDAVL